jgi:mannose-6-phosphate isomerase-like protein (cupin superfamily)
MRTGASSHLITRAAMTDEYGVAMARLVTHLNGSSPPFGAAIVEVDPGKAIRLHAHSEHEFYYVFSGTGTMLVGDVEYAATPGSLFYIPPDSEHSLRATTEVVRLCAVWWEPATAPTAEKTFEPTVRGGEL